jgi:hypothetical protein
MGHQPTLPPGADAKTATDSPGVSGPQPPISPEERERNRRDYEVSLLPTLGDGRVLGAQEQKELLLAIYSEVGNDWRELTEVRFKLLGLLPAVSIAIWAALVSNFDTMQKHATALLAAVVVCALGFAVTLGLFIYDWRNDAFYDDLISRGRKIEKELGVDTAIFLGRRKKEKRFINHSWGVRLVYWPMLVGWLMALAWFTLCFWHLRTWWIPVLDKHLFH